jgi:hypothetical protein
VSSSTSASDHNLPKILVGGTSDDQQISAEDKAEAVATLKDLLKQLESQFDQRKASDLVMKVSAQLLNF